MFYVLPFSLQGPYQRDVEMAPVDHHGAAGAPVEDADVAAERQRITGTAVERLADTDAVVLRQLTKYYNDTFLAVDRLTVGIPKGVFYVFRMFFLVFFVFYCLFYGLTSRNKD